MNTICRRVLLGLLLSGLIPGGSHAQSLRKLERGAINRTRITLVNGDTIQRFTTTLRHPQPRPDRFYYWQGQDRIQRNVGGYNGHLLDGPYQLTDRDDHLLGNGALRQGLKTGRWRTWRPDGSLASTSHWRQGRQQGRTKAYDVNSRPLPPVAAPLNHSPATVTATNAAAAPLTHWWQVSYWKIKIKRSKAARVAPTPGGAPVPVSPVPKKKSGSQKDVLPPVTPKPAGL